MAFGKLLIFLFICISLVASAVFSLKSFTGYLVSDIPDANSNLAALLFLAVGLFLSWIYLHNFRGKQQ